MFVLHFLLHSYADNKHDYNAFSLCLCVPEHPGGGGGGGGLEYKKGRDARRLA